MVSLRLYIPLVYICPVSCQQIALAAVLTSARCTNTCCPHTRCTVETQDSCTMPFLVPRHSYRQRSRAM